MSVRNTGWVFLMLILGVALVFATTAYNWHITEATVLGVKGQAESEHQKLRELRTLVEGNSAALQTLIESQRVGPRHTACDTKAILEDLRSGKVAPHYPVEDRCR